MMSRDEHIPASDGTDTTGFHGVEMIRDRCVYGFNFFAWYAVCVLARKGFGSSPSKGSARSHEVGAQFKRDTNVHIGTFAVLCRRRADVDLIVSFEITQRTQSTVIQSSCCGRSDAIDGVEQRESLEAF
jgi:hypothetical protein